MSAFMVRAATDRAERVIVVDALHESAGSFHEHFGFQVVPDVPLRVVMKASDAAVSLGLQLP